MNPKEVTLRLDRIFRSWGSEPPVPMRIIINLFYKGGDEGKELLRALARGDIDSSADECALDLVEVAAKLCGISGGFFVRKHKVRAVAGVDGGTEGEIVLPNCPTTDGRSEKRIIVFSGLSMQKVQEFCLDLLNSGLFDTQSSMVPPTKKNSRTESVVDAGV